MTASWESFSPSARPRRFRGGAIPSPDPVAWRRMRQAGVAPVFDERDGQAFAGFRIGRLTVDLDGVFAFLLFVPMLFAANLGSLSAAAIAGLVPIYLFVRRKQLERVLLPRLFLFVVPAFAVFSVVWSQAPKETLKYALELGITVVAGVLLSSARNPEAVLRGLTAAFLLYVLDAIAVGGTVAVGVGAGGTAFSGLTDSKNLLADISSTGLIVSLATGFLALKRRNWIWMAICGLAVMADFYCVFAARSAGAMLGLCMGVLPLLALTPLIAAGKAVRAWLTCTLAVVLLTAALAYRWIAQVMIDIGASMFDKDPTLTGRTYLWYRAADLIRERPMFGRGYYAFWIQGNVDAEGLWQYGGITNRSGFTFHNTLVEILVTMGWVGAGIIILTLLIGIVFLIRKFVTRPSIALVFWISLLLYELTRTPIETVGVAPLYFSTALVFAALAAGFGRVRQPRVAHQPIRTARIVSVTPVDYAAGWANPRLTPARGSLRVLRGGAGAPK